MPHRFLNVVLLCLLLLSLSERLYAQTQVEQSPAEQASASSVLNQPAPADAVSKVVPPHIVEPALPRDVSSLIQNLVEEISKRTARKPKQAVPPPDSGPVSLPHIEKPLTLTEPALRPDEIQEIVQNIPPSGNERKVIEKELTEKTEEIQKDKEGADEQARELIRRLSEYTTNPYVISGKRLAASKSRLSDIPANVSLITKEELLTRNPRTVQEAMALEEGVVMYDQIGNGWEDTFSLRGFETGTEVAVIVDGVRYNEPDGGVVNYSLLNVDDVESIEIARGSYSGVYGSSAFGGVVNITTRQAAEEKFRPFGAFEYGMNGLYDFAGGVSGTIPDNVTGMDGDAKYVFSMARTLADNIRSNSEIHQTHILNKWGYVWPDDVASTQIQISYADNAMSNPGELTVPQFHNVPEISTKPMDGRAFENLVLQFDSHLRLHDKVNWKFNAYRRMEDIDFTTTSISTIPSTARGVSQLLTTKAFTSSVSYDESIGFLKNTLEGGIEYRSEDENDRAKHISNPFSLPGFYGDQSINLETTGPFLQNTTEIFERVITTVGFRHDRIEYNYDDSSFPTIPAESDFDDTTMQVGTVLKLLDQTELYWNFSEGFRVPSISELFSVNFSGFGNPSLMPEESDSYEVGFRFRDAGPFTSNIGFFLIDLDNEILFDPGVGFFGQNVNVGTSRRSGVEFALKYKPRDWLESFFTYTYTEAKLRSTLPFPENSNAFFTEGGAFQSGDDIGLVPRNRFTLGFTVNPLKNIRIHLNGIYTGQQHSQAFEALGSAPAMFGAPVAARAVDSMIDGYFLVNGRLSVLWKEMEMFFQVSNIFNTEYISRSVTANVFSLTTFESQNIAFVTPGQGREMSIGTRLKFG